MNDIAKGKNSTVETLVTAGVTLIGLGMFLFVAAVLLYMFANS